MTSDDLFGVVKKTLVLIFFLVLLFVFLVAIRSTVLFFVSAGISAIAINPLVVFLERKHIPRTIAVISVIIAIVAIVVGIMLFLLPRIIQQGSDLLYQLPQLVTLLSSRTNALLKVAPGNNLNLVPALTKQIAPLIQSILSSLTAITFSFFSGIVYAVTFMSTMAYMLIYPQSIIRFLISLFPTALQSKAKQTFQKGSLMTVGWLKTNLIEGAIEGIVSVLFLSFFSVPGAVLWAVLTFIASLIPRLGPYMMTIPPLLVAFAINPLTGLWIFISYVILNEVVGDIIDPFLRSSQMQINPIVIIFSVLALASAFGILGAFIATPLAGFAKAAYEEFYLPLHLQDERSSKRVSSGK